MIRIHFHYLLVVITLLFASTSYAQDKPQACTYSQSKKVWFSNQTSKDTLSVSVIGNPCSKAIVSITVINASGKAIYNYSGEFIQHMPYLIYEPELNQLVQAFVKKILEEATNITTADLSPYTNVEQFYEDTNNFVIIGIGQYEELRKQTLPVLWHTTGDSTWVDVVFDPRSKQSRVIMRGGIFQ